MALTTQVWVDDFPTGTLIDIWRADGHNCAIGSYGVITATCIIKKGEELLMNYGDDDWAY